MNTIEAAPKPRTRERRPLWHHLYFWVLVGITIGIIIGFAAPETGAGMKWLADLFIKLVKVVIAPTTSMVFLLFPFPIPAPVFAVLYLLASSLMMRRGDHVAHEAHIGGAIAGFALAGLLFEPGFEPLIAALRQLAS